MFFKIRYLASLIIVLIAAYFIYPLIRNNIHAVIPNQVYRSAELSHETLREVIQTYHIKSILNLRGPHPNEKWYQLERDEAQKNNIHFYTDSLPAHQMPTVTELQTLIQDLKNAPRPILIHCKNGADRSGLLSALAVILFTDRDISQANKQISFWYFAFSPNSVGRLVMPKYEAWLQKNNVPSNAKNLTAWINAKNPLI